MSSADLSSSNLSSPSTGKNDMASVITRPESVASSTSQGDLRAKAEGAISKVGEVVREAADETRRSATTLASEANEKVKALMGQQVGAGVDLVGHFAASARLAADDLDRNAPQVAALIRDASQRMQQFSRELQDQSIDQLVRRTSDFARKRPAAMFGAAAVCGFFLFRLFKAGTRPSGTGEQAAFGGSGYHPDSPSIPPQGGPSHGA